MSQLWFSLIISAIFPIISADIDIVVKQCREDWCNSLDHEDPRFMGPDYYKNVFNLMSSGLPQLVYSDIPELLIGANVSSSCQNALRQVDKGFDEGKEWAFRLVDSSAKTPSAFMDGTVTSLGDYDECIGISGPTPDLQGQYCIMDIFPMQYHGKIPRTDGQITLNHMQHINDSAYYFGLCWPTGCHQEDIISILSKVLEPFPLKVHGHTSCDSRETISIVYRLKNMRFSSMIAMTFLLTILALIAYGTLNHLFLPDKKDIRHLRSFSLIENTYKLLYVDPNARPDTYISLWACTYYKMMIIICGVAAHVMACIELPLGFLLLSHHRELEKLMSMPALMPIFGEAGITTSSSVTAFATMMMVYPMAKKGKINYTKAVMDKALRFVLPVLAIVSLDMVYYIPFSGPFLTRTSAAVVEKCSKYWWRSAVFVSNLFDDPINICSGHTYSLSVDVQIFAIGLLGIMILAKRPKLGLLYCTTWAMIGIGIGYYYVAKHNLTPNMMIARNPSVYELEMFLKYIHMSTSGYLFAYFSSLIAAYFVVAGFWNEEAKRLNFFHHAKWLAIITLFINLAQYSPILTNYLDIVPRSLIPLFVVSVRIVVGFEMAFFLTYLAILDIRDEYDKKRNDFGNGKPSEVSVKPEKKQFSLFKAFFRLSFAIFMCNYLLIRTDFFTSREVLYTSLYSYGKRLIATLVYLMPLSFLYHLCFVAPFFNLYNDLTKRPPSSSKKDE